MRIYFIIGLLLAFSPRLFAQETTANAIDSSLMNSFKHFELKIEHYNLSDTANNEFAAYLIKTGFKNYMIRREELKESSLDQNNKSKQNLFRILSEPSFNHPICFTISIKNNQRYLTWTIGKGSGGYEPKGIKKKGKVKIPDKDWNYFKQLIDINSIDTLPLASYLPMTDGTSWTIEKNINNIYKIYFTNTLPAGLKDGFALLSHISGIKNNEITHFFNGTELRFFDKNNNKISLDSLAEKVRLHLNNDFSEKLKVDKYCFDWDIYIKINSREKVKSVKYIPYILPHLSLKDRFEYFVENFEDRKFLNEVKKSLSRITISEFNLSQSIWIPVYIGCDKQKRILKFNSY
ncbi:MAG: hypothetical protein HRU69_01410 [Flammeovirgaceae bacterium]|nr:MAG: hypothetical protein HRU69_01410 [Flammeovirgaceae bacterium]